MRRRRLALMFSICSCWGVMCVSNEIREGVRITAKYMPQYVEYANGKIEENPDERAEEMVGIGKRLDANLEKVNKYFNGDE